MEINIDKLRDLFIKRMTVDSETRDMRRKDFNQAIFGWWDDDNPNNTPENTYQCFSNTDMSMVLTCFDNAVDDYKRLNKQKNIV